MATPVNNYRHILIVDGDLEHGRALASRLAEHGLSSSAVGGGLEMMRQLQSRRCDLVLLEVALPGDDGLTLCRALRASGEPFALMPVIFISSLDEAIDRVAGLEAGGDDYLSKPFQVRELVARIRAVLRRTCCLRNARSCCVQEKKSAALEPGGLKAASGCLSFGVWRLNTQTRCLVDSAGGSTGLSAAEYRLLTLFLENPNRLLSRDNIMDHINEGNLDIYDRSIDVLISRLRRKLRDNARKPGCIQTVRGGGYMFINPVCAEPGTSGWELEADAGSSGWAQRLSYSNYGPISLP